MMKAIVAEIRRSLERGERRTFRVVTDSMSPVITVGSMIQVERLPAGGAADLERFQIVLFDEGSHLTCHFFWSRNELPDSDGQHLCLTRSLHGADMPIPESSLIGVVVSHRVPWQYRFGLFGRFLAKRLASGVMGH
ncbi:MAG TPA: S24/S26 family peptidase [Bdellovibrionota bacterium]|nr:S24/S26 family peptidase [Bdellovibrionota bacterium]